MDVHNWVPNFWKVKNKNGAFGDDLYSHCTSESPSDQFVINIFDKPTSGNHSPKESNIVKNDKPIQELYITTKAHKNVQDKCSLWFSKKAILLVCTSELIFFIVDSFYKDYNLELPLGPTGQFFIYDPRKRHQIWRYFTYIFVHKNYFHLGVNLIGQIVFGLPLEEVNSSCRTLMIYFAGVVAGSLCMSITDPTSRLAGASGGVYSLLAAFIILKWKNHGVIYVVIYPTLFCVDMVISIIRTLNNNHLKTGQGSHIGYASHVSGAAAGLLVGILLLKKLKVTRTDHILWWAALIVYVISMSIGIGCNVVQVLSEYYEYLHRHL